jgi:uncharacterized protein
MSRLFLGLAFLALVIWAYKNLRGPGQASRQDPTQAPKTPEPEDMVACSHCRVMVPKSESWPGRGGVYCSKAHRERAEPEGH